MNAKTEIQAKLNTALASVSAAKELLKQSDHAQGVAGIDDITDALEDADMNLRAAGGYADVFVES